MVCRPKVLAFDNYSAIRGNGRIRQHNLSGCNHRFDKSLYEAAAVDGASRFQQITKVMVPMLMPVITVLTLIKVGRIFFTDFGLFFNIPRNSGPLYDVTNVIETYVFRALRQTGDIGMASAAGFYQAVVGFIVVLTANYIVRKIDKDSSLFKEA